MGHLLLLSAIVSIVTGGRAAAQAFSLTYDASPNCPALEEVRADIAARVRPGAAAAGASVAIRIERLGGTFTGDLRTVDLQGQDFLAGLSLELGHERPVAVLAWPVPAPAVSAPTPRRIAAGPVRAAGGFAGTAAMTEELALAIEDTRSGLARGQSTERGCQT